jgi:hypothetical protein
MVGLLLCLLATACIPFRTASAQIVRGSVVERTTAAPLAGVLVELRNEADSQAVANVLSSESGAFSVRAPAAGRYFLEAKRIGVTRFRSEVIALQLGETIVREIPLDPVTQLLPVVRVSTINSCSANPEERARVAALWDEVGTALTATNVSLRDELFRANVRRYVRELDPKSLKPRSETQSTVSALVTIPFAAVHAETLSTRGYWHYRSDGRLAFFGPDPTLLLSEVFTRDHCLRLAPTNRRRRAFVGLSFSPTEPDRVPGIAGVMWLDAKTFRLTSVEFSYTSVPTGTDSAALGGSLTFSQLNNGAWLVRSWSLRLPAGSIAGAPLSTDATNAPWVLVRPERNSLQEIGGEVTGEVIHRPARSPQP